MKDTPPLELAPSSLVALAAAAQRASSVRKPGTPSSHRRSQTIVVAGELELEQIHKHKIVEELHSELESKSKELEESQEEAQLAARIGQTLLQRNQEIGAESESRVTELIARAETAEHELKVMWSKLDKALIHVRSLELARTRATLEAEQLTQELGESRTLVSVVKGELSRANDELQRSMETIHRLEDEVESCHATGEAQALAIIKLQTELAAKNERIEVLLSAERYNVEHISRLEIENQLICQQHHVLMGREKQLQFEHELAASRFAAQAAQLKSVLARNHELETALVGVHGEMEELRESLQGEQARVHHLSRRNQELLGRLERQKSPQRMDNEQEEQAEDNETQQLRTGSLFFELARQLQSELREARTAEQRKKAEPAPQDPSPPELALDSPSASSTRTSRNPSSNCTDSLHDADESAHTNQSAPTSTPTPTQPPTPTPTPTTTPTLNTTTLPTLHLERRRSLQHDEDQDEDGILKEFFLLTAAAVKSAGGGLRNDACNIRNEDLYAEAVADGVTFDQYHRWLERRLGDDLEISADELAPMTKCRRDAMSASVLVPPTPTLSSSFLFFWGR